MGPSLPTHVKLLYWNGQFRYADKKALMDVLDYRRAPQVQFYHPWGLWATMDCEKEIDAAVCGPLLILRFGDHPDAGLHLELTIGLRELSYQLFHAGSENFYIVLPKETFIPDSNNAMSRFGWGLNTPVSFKEFEEAESDSRLIALCTCSCLHDIISWELGGAVHFRGRYGPDLPVSMAAAILRGELEGEKGGN